MKIDAPSSDALLCLLQMRDERQMRHYNTFSVRRQNIVIPTETEVHK